MLRKSTKVYGLENICTHFIDALRNSGKLLGSKISFYDETSHVDYKCLINLQPLSNSFKSLIYQSPTGVVIYFWLQSFFDATFIQIKWIVVSLCHWRLCDDVKFKTIFLRSCWVLLIGKVSNGLKQHYIKIKMNLFGKHRRQQRLNFHQYSSSFRFLLCFESSMRLHRNDLM